MGASEETSKPQGSQPEQIGSTSGSTGHQKGKSQRGKYADQKGKNLEDKQRLATERQQRLYRRQLEGLTIRQLVLDHQDREGISNAQAWRDWNVVKDWNEQDWSTERETMLARVNNMRLRVIDKAIRRGQLSTAADLLRQLGAAAGEGQEMAQMQAAPQLNISVELPASEAAGALPAPQPVDVELLDESDN